MAKNPWVNRWEVPGSNGKCWTVGQRADGTFGCSCPAWKFAHAPKPDCHHITHAKALLVRGKVPGETPPEVVLANVRGVTPKPDRKGRIRKVLVPLMPIGDAHFALTIAHDLAVWGVPTEYIREHYLFGNSLKTAIAYIRARGRRIYGPWKKGKGFVGYTTLDADNPSIIQSGVGAEKTRKLPARPNRPAKRPPGEPLWHDADGN